jgi:hypothetical protein
MNHSGDAAEQIVRLSLEGVEVAARITGTAAKEIAVLLIAALKNDSKHLKTKGKARLTAMLNSGKPLEIFSVKESDLKTFTQQAKKYGVVYCALRDSKNSPDGMCDILVKADDAPKINRIVERFKFATVDKAKIESEIVAARAEQAIDAEPEAPDLVDTEQLLDDLLGTDEGQVEPDTPEAVQAEPHIAEAEDARPLASGGELPPTSPPSEPISESKNKSARATSTKPSVREELREIKAARKEAEKSPDAPAPEKPKDKSQTTKHKQPKGKRIKSKKGKHER